MTDDTDEALQRLRGRLPSQRMAAAQWLAENAGSDHIVPITVALESESVRNIRNVLSIALRQARSRDVELLGRPADDSAPDGPEQVLNRVPGIVRHELGGSIGSLRLAADSEIAPFESSETNRAIESLRLRIEGLESLLSTYKEPRYETLLLGEVLAGNQSIDQTGLEFIGDTDYELSIESDPGLLAIILRNVYQNAVEARDRTPSRGAVVVDWGATEREFWVTVVNDFDGELLELDDVRAEGVTSKRDHPGIGLKLIESAAERLEYEIDLQGASGTVVFSLRGTRNRAAS